MSSLSSSSPPLSSFPFFPLQLFPPEVFPPFLSAPTSASHLLFFLLLHYYSFSFIITGCRSVVIVIVIIVIIVEGGNRLGDTRGTVASMLSPRGCSERPLCPRRVSLTLCPSRYHGGHRRGTRPIPAVGTRKYHATCCSPVLLPVPIYTTFLPPFPFSIPTCTKFCSHLYHVVATFKIPIAVQILPSAPLHMHHRRLLA